MRLRRFIEQTLRADGQMTIGALLDATNAWARQGHSHMGHALWPGDHPFGPRYLALLLREDWAAGLASAELRRQARFLRENPDRNLDDLARETRARVEALRAREVEKRERQARKQKEAQKARAEREERARAERERRERKRTERERRAAQQTQQRHHTALLYVAGFLRADGLEATSDGRAVHTADVVVNISEAQAASRAKLHALLDEVVWSRYRDVLLRSIGRHLTGGPELRAVAGTNGWVLSHGRAPLVVIRATDAKVKSMPSRSGNFLTKEGADWADLAADVQAIRAHDVTQRIIRPPERRVFTELPERRAPCVAPLGTRGQPSIADRAQPRLRP